MSSSSSLLSPPPAVLTMNPTMDSKYEQLDLTPWYKRNIPSINSRNTLYFLPPKVIAGSLKRLSDNYHYDWFTKAEQDIPEVQDEIIYTLEECIVESFQEWQASGEGEFRIDDEAVVVGAKIDSSKHDMIPSSIKLRRLPKRFVQTLEDDLKLNGFDNVSVKIESKKPEFYDLLSKKGKNRTVSQGVRIENDFSSGSILIDPTFQSFVMQGGRRSDDPVVFGPPKMVSMMYDRIKASSKVGISSSKRYVKILESGINQDINHSFKDTRPIRHFTRLDHTPSSAVEAVQISSNCINSFWLRQYPKSCIENLESILREQHAQDDIRVSKGLTSINPSCVTMQGNSTILRLSAQGRPDLATNENGNVYYLSPLTIASVLSQFRHPTAHGSQTDDVIMESHWKIKSMMQDTIRECSWKQNNSLIAIPINQLATDTRHVVLGSAYGSSSSPWYSLDNWGNKAIEFDELHVVSYPESHIAELVNQLQTSFDDEIELRAVA
ncbi:uncharacterized protein L199_002645 [Kwoniella botswanensis]|uniref:uncharacterized protein n=1 Tax=Kwoniella botswanensis TaxID=1268659 RepID=UPI00315DFFFA